MSAESAHVDTSRLGVLPRVLLLTDRSQLPLGRSLVATVAAAVGAGVDRVVLRELDLADEQRAALAADLLAAGATVIAAHRPLPGCAAVQLSASSSGSAGAGFGRSCHSRADLERAAAEGAAYATLGPYAATASKPGHGPPVDPTAYADPPLPTYALGGVTPHNAAAAVVAGASGVAVMGAVMRAADPAATAAALLAAVG
jgi:thiamine-phosphate pyrophosphorylase